MEITFKLTEEMMQEAFQRAMENIEIQTAGLTLNECVEKQIPQKPDISGDGYADGVLVYDTYQCPNCGRYYEIDYDDFDYCPKCGQRFDWEDSEV